MKIIKKNLKVITILVILVFIIGAFVLKYSLKRQATPKSVELEVVEEEVVEEKEEVVPTLVYVDLKGAVVAPGVYEIEEGKKVIDAINLAGGLAENADTSLINLAKKVTNEMVVIIYTTEEVKKATETDAIARVIDNQCVCPSIKNDGCLQQESSSNNSDTSENTNSTSQNQENGKVNINTATLEELQQLSGIGESKAQAIIDYRSEHGNFEKIEDLLEVSGIGEALYEKIKDNITV